MEDNEIKHLIEQSEVHLLERIEQTETTLLKEFRKWAVRIEATTRTNHSYAVGFDERLRVLESRMDDFDEGGKT